jgi:hypothetical protein
MKTLSFRQSACICTIVVSIGIVFASLGANRTFADESLDQLLATAMEKHPDIVAAKAKVTLAEAELNAARLQVARQLIALWGEKNTQTTTVDQIEQQLKTNLEPNKRSLLTNTLQEARVKSEMAETVMKFLTAESTPVASQSKDTAEPPKELQAPDGPIVEELRKEFRTKTINLEFVDTPLSQVIDYMKDDLKYPIYIDVKTLGDSGIASDMPITMNMQKTPLPAVIQALQDQNQGLIFVIRDYGILLTTIEHAKAQGYCPAFDFGR